MERRERRGEERQSSPSFIGLSSRLVLFFSRGEAGEERGLGFLLASPLSTEEFIDLIAGIGLVISLEELEGKA